jgi:hypothetical protein
MPLIVRRILLGLAILCAVVAALIDVEVFDWEHYGFWLAAAVGFGLASRWA